MVIKPPSVYSFCFFVHFTFLAFNLEFKLLFSYSVPSNLLAQSTPATDQIPREVSNPPHERPDGGGRKTGPVPPRDVGHCPPRKLTGRGQRTPLRLAGRILGRFASTSKVSCERERKLFMTAADQ